MAKIPRAERKREKQHKAVVLDTLKKFSKDLPVSQNQLIGLVNDEFTDREVKAAAKHLPASDFSPVTAEPGPRNSIQYGLLVANA